MPSSVRTSEQSHLKILIRLAATADTIGAMLAIVHLLPVDGQSDALAVSANLANELAHSVAALVGGAA